MGGVADGSYLEQSLPLAGIKSPANVAWAADTSHAWYGFYSAVFTDWTRPIRDGGCPDNEGTCAQNLWTRILANDYTEVREFPWSYSPAWTNKAPAFRHSRTGPRTGIANVVFCDGHVKAMPFGKLKLNNILPSLD